MNKSLKKDKLIHKFVNRIKKIYPRSKEILVKTKTKADGRYETKIEIATKGNLMVATKSDDTYKKSLEKSYHAIVRQIHKSKTKMKRRKLNSPDFYKVA